MLEITEFKPEEIDETIEALDTLRDIISPVLRSINGDGMGEQDVQDFVRHLTLAKHALIAMGDFLESKMVGGTNTPLTLAELRKTDKEPVWIERCGSNSPEDREWALVDLKYEVCRTTQGGLAIFELYGKTWLAYRHKPEPGTLERSNK